MYIHICVYRAKVTIISSRFISWRLPTPCWQAIFGLVKRRPWGCEIMPFPPTNRSQKSSVTWSQKKHYCKTIFLQLSSYVSCSATFLQCWTVLSTGFSRLQNPTLSKACSMHFAFQAGPGIPSNSNLFWGAKLPRAFFAEGSTDLWNMFQNCCATNICNWTISSRWFSENSEVEWLAFLKVPLMGKKEKPPWFSVVKLDLKSWSLEVEQLEI